MKGIIVVLALLCLAELMGIVQLLRMVDRAEKARKRAIENGQRWTWTKRGEEKLQEAKEMVCDKCHEPYRCGGQDELDIVCAMCKVPSTLRKLQQREEA
jgi:hypothetical protein